MKRLSVVVLLLLSCSVASAQSKPAPKQEPTAGAPAIMAKPGPMPAPTPDKANEGLKPFVGAWTCEGKTTLPGMGEVAYKSSVKNKWDLGNFWLTIEYKREKTKALPAFNAWAVWGYDAGTKKFLFMGPDSWGGHIFASSAGPQGGTIVWDGEAVMGPQLMPMKMTVTRDDKGHGLKFAAVSNNQTIFEDTCK